MNTQAMQLDLLRHGECEGGAIFRGSTNVNLLPSGFNTMRAVCETTAQDWELIISSPMQRCFAFASYLAKKNAIPLVADERLREMSFGVWEGCEISQIWREQGDLMRGWSHNPLEYTPPGGEPLVALLARVTEFFDELALSYGHKKILLVTHGGVIRSLLGHFLGMSPANMNRFDVPYASLSRVLVFDDEGVQRIKLHAHNFAHFVAASAL